MALLLETLNEIWFMTDMRFQLFDQDGQRKYLTAQEREAFLAAAEHTSREVRTLCLLLTFTGCRLSEALALTADRVDIDARTVTFETLKKRRQGIRTRIGLTHRCAVHLVNERIEVAGIPPRAGE